jgi:hypothetical protein
MKKLQLFIPTPCHENWDNMTAMSEENFVALVKTSNGLFNMSDHEIAQFLKPSTGSVCGRFVRIN